MPLSRSSQDGSVKLSQLVPRWRGWRLVIAGTLLLLGSFSQLKAEPTYYLVSEIDAAEAAAARLHLPLAWVGGNEIVDLTVDLHEDKSRSALTQMAMAALKGNAVIIFFEKDDLHLTPNLVRDRFWTNQGHVEVAYDWDPPELVFTDPTVSTIYGSILDEDMQKDRDEPIRSMLQSIQNKRWLMDQAALRNASIPIQNENFHPLTLPVVGPVSSRTILAGFGFFTWISSHELDLALSLLGFFIVVFCVLGASRRPSVVEAEANDVSAIPVELEGIEPEEVEVAEPITAVETMELKI